MGLNYEEKVASIVDQEYQDQESDSDVLTLDSGVALRVTKIPPMLLADVEKRFPKPPVPKVHDETKGRAVENPNDPGYLAAVEANESDKSLAMTEVMVGKGTELVSIPAGMETPEDDGWKEEAEFYLGREIPAKSSRTRYLFWLKYYALTSQDDLVRLSNKVARKMGVSQEDVGTALNSFRDQT